MKTINRINSLRYAVCMTVAAPIVPLALPAGAQQLEEVVVTAQRREQSLQDIPMSISAVTGESLEIMLIDDIIDLQYSIPNLVVDGTRTTIRGVGNNALSSTAEDGLGYHVNDVYLNTPLFVTSEYFDLERVEVLRGPQGTLYGRNTTAGVINIYTRKPHDELGGYLTSTVGNYDTLKFKGALNIPVTENLRQRFSGMYLSRDGYTDNKYSGNEVDGRDSYELRSSTAFDFSEDFTADLVISYVNEDSDRSQRTKGVCTKDAETGCSPLSAGFETPDVSNSIFQTINGLLGGTIMPSGDYFSDSVNPDEYREVNMDQEPTYEVEQLGISLEFNYEFEDYRLTALTGYYDTDAEVFWDFDRFTTDVRLFEPVTYRANAKDYITTDIIQSGRRDLRDAEQFTQEFRIASDYDGWFNFLLGAFYYDEDRSSQSMITHPSIAVYQQTLGLPVDFEMYNVESDPVKTESFALFGEGYFEINEKTRLTLGLRYTDDEKESRSRIQFLSPDNADWMEAKDDWQEVTGKATLEYSVNEDSMLFASFARGYKAGGLNPPDAPSEDLAFDPEVIYAYEVGSKNLFLDGKLQANFGAFYYDYEDLQLGQITETTTLTVNGDAEVMGIEAEFYFSPTENLLFDFNFSWLDLEIDDFQSADQGDPNGIAPGTTPALDEDGNIRYTEDGELIKDLDGNTLRNSPEYSFKVGAQYDFSFLSGYDLTARTDYFWQDDYYANEFNKPSDELDGWEQLDASLTLRPQNSFWQVKAFVKNALDNDDLLRMNQDGPLVGRFRSVNVMEPRTYGLELRMDFE